MVRSSLLAAVAAGLLVLVVRAELLVKFPNTVVFAQHGTYVKESISGEGGATRPSLSELVGAPCECVELDVLAILGERTGLAPKVLLPDSGSEHGASPVVTPCAGSTTRLLGSHTC